MHVILRQIVQTFYYGMMIKCVDVFATGLKKHYVIEQIRIEKISQSLTAKTYRLWIFVMAVLTARIRGGVVEKCVWRPMAFF